MVAASFASHQVPPLGQISLLNCHSERPMAIDSLNLKLRQVVRFSSNVILDEMSAKCLLLFGFLFYCSTGRKTTLPCTYGNFSFFDCSTGRKTTLPCTNGNFSLLGLDRPSILLTLLLPKDPGNPQSMRDPDYCMGRSCHLQAQPGLKTTRKPKGLWRGC